MERKRKEVIMYINLAFSGDAFERLIKYRLVEEFRPLPFPIEHPQNTWNWLDGVTVHRAVVSRLLDGRTVHLNEVNASGLVRPVPQNYVFQGAGIQVDVSMTVHLAKVQDVAAAGLAQPPTHNVPILPGILRIFIRAEVGEDGIPHLSMQLDTGPLEGMNLPAPVINALASSATDDIPFDIAGLLEDVLPPGNNRVINTGITLDDNGDVIFSFELPGRVSRSAVTRWQEWNTFATLPPTANLGGHAWAVDLEGSAVAEQIAREVGPVLQDKKPIAFDQSWLNWSFHNGNTPRVIVEKLGRIVNACAGNDLRFKAFINIDFSVPPPGNLLRGRIGFDYTKNGGDVAKCAGITLLNPLSLFITLFDQGKVGLGFASLAMDLVFPTRPVIVMTSLAFLVAGVDTAVARNVVNEHLAKEPAITRLPDGGYAFEQSMTISNPLTRDWLVLLDTIGVKGRMLLRGALNVPDPVLPRLTASDLTGFGSWFHVNHCEPGRGQESRASLQLTLKPGYGASQGTRRPNIPIHYAPRPGGGDLIYDVLNDHLGVFQDPHTGYRQIEFPGIPGRVEARLKGETLRKEVFKPFARNPYPLRLRFYTNGGVREYEFAAPEPYREYKETLAEAAERINRCKQLGHDLLTIKYLEVFWLIDPPPDSKVAQHWEITITGVQQGQKLSVWDRETGVQVGEAQANVFGRMDVSLILAGERQARSLLLGLDNVPFLHRSELMQISNAPSTDTRNQIPLVTMNQSSLLEVEQVNLTESVKAAGLAIDHKQPLLIVQDQKGRTVLRPASVSSGAGISITGLPQKVLFGHNQDFKRIIPLPVTQSGSGVHPYDEPADFYVDLGNSNSEVLLYAGEDGRQLTLYQRARSEVVGGLQWREESSEVEL
jgi:hypothetical protein